VYHILQYIQKPTKFKRLFLTF